MNISKQKAINVLEEMYEMAYSATLTGALRDGGQSLVITYNALRDLAIKNKWADEDLLAVLPLSMDANNPNMANVGTSARLLAKILEDEEAIEAFEAPQAEQVAQIEQYDENGYEIKDEDEIE